MAAPFDYEELQGSPTYKIDKKGGSAMRMLRVAWSDIDAAAQWFSPLPTAGGSAFPGLSFLRVEDLSIEPFLDSPPTGFGEDPATYPCGAKLTVNYKTPTYDTGQGSGPGGSPPNTDNSPKQGDDPKANSDTVLSHKVSISGEFMIVPSYGLKWEDHYEKITDKYNEKDANGNYKGGNLLAGEVQAGMMIPHISNSITWHYVSNPPWTAIKNTIGKVNQARFAGCEPMTLLFLGAEASIDFVSTGLTWGTKTWTLDYKFAHKNNTTFTKSIFLFGNFVINSFIITNTVTTNLIVGMSVSGTGIAPGTKIASIDSPTQITVTKAVIQTRTISRLYFYTPTNPTPHGWNDYFRPESGRFEKLIRSNVKIAGKKPIPPGQLEFYNELQNPNAIVVETRYVYEQADFLPLFVPGA